MSFVAYPNEYEKLAADLAIASQAHHAYTCRMRVLQALALHCVQRIPHIVMRALAV